MKKWLFVTLGLLLAVPTVASAKTFRLAWGTWAGGTGGTTFTSAMGDSGTAFFNGTNSINSTSAISLRDMKLRPYSFSDASGNSGVGNPVLKIIVTGSSKGSWGNLACRVEKSVDGYVWEVSDVSSDIILVASPISSLTSQAYTSMFEFEPTAGDVTQPLGYIRIVVYSNGTGSSAKVTGAKCYIAYEEDQDYEQVIKPGKWDVDANTTKDTTTVLGFTGRDTTTAFDISDIAPFGMSFMSTVADSSGKTMGAYLVLRQNATSIATVADSIYISTDVSYDGGTTWAGNREFIAGGTTRLNANSFGTLLGDFSSGGQAVVPVPLMVASNSSAAYTSATGRSAYWLYGATHVRFRVAATAGKALPTFKPFIVYWRNRPK